MSRNALAEMIEATRIRRGDTYQIGADAVGVDIAAFWRWAGGMSLPAKRHAFPLSKYLGTTPHAVLVARERAKASLAAR